MDICVHMLCSFVGSMPSRGIAGHMVNSRFSVEKQLDFSKVAGLFFLPTNNV
jgi:hypothetical protein